MQVKRLEGSYEIQFEGPQENTSPQECDEESLFSLGDLDFL